MTDDELVQTCKRNRVEEWLHESGCFVGLAVGFLACIVVVVLRFCEVFTIEWPFAVLIGLEAFVFVGAGTFGLLQYLSRFRCRHSLCELEDRYGCRPLAEYVAKERRTLVPGEVVILFSGHTPPSSASWWVRVRLSKGGGATVEARLSMVHDFGTGRPLGDLCQAARGQISGEEAARLMDLASQVRKGKTVVRSTVMDGFPVSCAVVWGDTKRVSTISCNLTGVPDSHVGKAHIGLVEEVFRASRGLIDMPLMYGCCDFRTGEIDIGDV